MGAKFDSNNGYAPIKIYGGSLHGITYRLPIPSAQVKSAIMLAAIHADGKTEIIEPYPSRDHTERMLKYFECNIKVKDKKIIITPDGELKAKNITIPGDISSAAYFMVAGLLVKNARITIKNVGLNPTRTGVIDVLKKMWGKIKTKNIKVKYNEPVGDIVVSSSKLKGITIGGKIIPRVIDEIPVIVIAASYAKGKTVIKNAEELRVKESDRIKTIVTNLLRLGVKVVEREDGMIVYGNEGKPFKYVDIDSFGDHRIAMAFSVAALVSENGLLIKDTECINSSFPDFYRTLNSLRRK